MGVDYSAVGGIGVEVTSDIKKKLVVANEGDFDGCMHSLLSDLKLTYSEGGDGNYSGDENTFYIMAEGGTLKDVIESAEELSIRLKTFGIDISPDDFDVIQDLHVW